MWISLKALKSLLLACLLLAVMIADGKSDGEIFIYAYQGDVAIYEYNGYYGIINRSGEHLTEALYDEIFPFDKYGIAEVSRDGLYGYINNKGDIILDAQWECREENCDGFYIYGKNGLEGAINDKGVLIVNPISLDIRTYDDGYAVAKMENEYIVYSYYGEELFSVTGDGIFYDNGYFAVCSEQGSQLLDLSGALVSSRYWHYLCVAVNESGDEIIYGIDTIDGDNYCIGCDIAGNELWRVSADRCEDAVDGYIGIEREDKWGCINLKGDMMVEPCWDMMLEFKYGLAPAYRSEKWYIIKEDGSIQIDEYYDKPPHIFENSILVTKDGISYMIDYSGNRITKFSWSSGYADIKDGYLWIKGDDYSAYIDEMGNEYYVNEFDYGCEFMNGLAWVRKDGMYYILDILNDEVIATDYDAVVPIDDESTFFIARDSAYQYYIVNTQGEKISPAWTTYEYDGVIFDEM